MLACHDRKLGQSASSIPGSAHPPMFFNPISRWALAALAPVFQLLDIRREPGLAPNGTHFDVASADSLGLSGFLRF